MRVRLLALVVVLLQAAGSGVALAQGVAISSGSGFIVSRSAEILTNFHVVKGCSSLTVQIGNGSTEKAELIARDETNDLAIIRINAAVTPVGAFRESPPIRAGEQVIALGYPLFGFHLNRGLVRHNCMLEFEVIWLLFRFLSAGGGRDRGIHVHIS